jgi:DNA replicative helicase MCM subunit Mcm2 (Cdc46/Mcm family)
MAKILQASIRSLESIIRLSYAYAKLRMSKIVEIQDAVHSLYIYLESFYGGYENVNKIFFEGYEEYLVIGKS